MKKLRSLLLSLVFLFFFQPVISYSQNLFINEVLAINNSTIQDPDFNFYSDWIEIYNAGSYPINLKDYSITDDLSEPQKYIIPSDLIITAGGYILLWADDMNGGVHTNFKLSSSGESLGLFKPSGEVVNVFTFTEQEPDISVGRYPDGGAEVFRFYPSSPASANMENNIFKRVSVPEFSVKGGFYSSTVFLTLSNPEPGVSILYTIDGTTPTINSQLYTNPIQINTTIAVTAVCFREGYTSSKPVVNTYFINFQTDLSVFSIVTDPANFFSDTSGIYVEGINGIPGNCSTYPRNWNQDWERPINLEFYEKNKSLAFNLKAGVKISGACTRIYPMKSLAVYFRSSYGEDRLKYRMFPDIPILSFNNFILRSGGQDWWRTMFREEMVQILVKQGMKIAYQEYRPALVFINGQYWGIHNIREKLDDHYIQSHYGVDRNNIDLVELSKGIYSNNGDLTAYNSMIDFLSGNDMSLQENYDYIKSIADMDDYIDFMTAEIYSANYDFPGTNVKLWRERTPEGKWRWMLYDLDFTFGGNANGQYYSNTLEHASYEYGASEPNPPWSTLMFRMLLNNTEFREEFIQRFAAHMNTTYNPEYVIKIIDSLSAVIASEIPRHKNRWEKSISLGPDWLTNIQVMKDFAYLRQPEVRNHFYSKFNIFGSYSLTISRNNPDWGRIYTHNIEVKQNSSLNTFFKNIPLKIRAFPNPGYRFAGWEGIVNSASINEVVINSTDSYLKAIFEPVELMVTTLVINEINYKSSPSFDTEDWIEFYNPVEQAINISGWKIMDDNPANAFTFPAGSEIPGNGYLVVCRDSSKFNLLHKNINNVFGNINFGLNSDSDVLLLFDADNNLVDSVLYFSSGEWTPIPNGNGPTLALVNPQSDNSRAENWRASDFYGTPGRLNDTYTKAETETAGPADFYLYDNYPNPFNPETVIRYSIPIHSRVVLKIFDPLGNDLETLVNEEKPSGIYQFTWNASGLPSGVYFYRIQAGSFVYTKKMVVVK